MQLSRQKVFLIIGILLAGAAIFMTKTYLDQERQKIQQRVEEETASREVGQVKVLVSTQEIPRGSPITEAMVKAKTIPNQYVQPRAVTSLEQVQDMTTTAPISKDEQITLTKLAYSKTQGGLSEVTPMGKRAITISVDNIAALAGMLKAGDYVDVLSMIPMAVATGEGKEHATQLVTIPLFQNVLVLAVGQQTTTTIQKRYTEEEDGKGVATPLITLALSPQEANLIAFVQEQGKIRLTLRSPADSKIEPMQPANWDTLLQYIMPKIEKPEKPKDEPKAEGYVEIYRGLNKEKVPIYK